MISAQVLTATVNIGHFSLLVDCLINLVVTQLIGFCLISLGVVISPIYKLSGSTDVDSSVSFKYKRFYNRYHRLSEQLLTFFYNHNEFIYRCLLQCIINNYNILVTPNIAYSLLLQARCHLPLTVTNEIAPTVYCQI